MNIDLNLTWLNVLNDTLHNGVEVSPRGQLTREIPQRTIEIDMRHPVLTVPERKLSYQFMAAEAFWILTGDFRVETIAPYNKHISQFSDDGETFFGAYGPKIATQLDYVVDKLRNDSDTRQAGLTIWRENPPQTKDVPCTVAIFFGIRQGLLNCHVFMRSSDLWLGVPYDIFNFSMLAHRVCALLNMNYDEHFGVLAKPGTLYLTAASSHLYEHNFTDAMICIQQGRGSVCKPTPLYMHLVESDLMTRLQLLRDTTSGNHLRWWES